MGNCYNTKKDEVKDKDIPKNYMVVGTVVDENKTKQSEGSGQEIKKESMSDNNSLDKKLSDNIDPDEYKSYIDGLDRLIEKSFPKETDSVETYIPFFPPLIRKKMLKNPIEYNVKKLFKYFYEIVIIKSNEHKDHLIYMLDGKDPDVKSSYGWAHANTNRNVEIKNWNIKYHINDMLGVYNQEHQIAVETKCCIKMFEKIYESQTCMKQRHV